MAPNTVETLVLLGWMERDSGISFLRQCVFDPPITDEQAIAIWQEYHAKVEAIPEREAKAPERITLRDDEREVADRFLETHRSRGATNILDIVKVDPRDLVIHQLSIVLDRARAYMDHVTARTWCMRHCLATPNAQQHTLEIQAGMNAMNIKVPHAEFGFVFLPNGGFQVQEMARHLSVTAFDNRMLLWAGYHRSFARMASTNPDATDRSLLAVLTTDADFALSPDAPNQGLCAMVRGVRPPLLRDFLDDRLFIRVQLRKKRFELQIRSNVVAVDYEP